LTSFNSSWTMLMVFWSKFGSFGTNFAATRFIPKTKNCMALANQYVDILSIFSNSDSITIHHNNFLHCFNIFVGCWRAGTSRTGNVMYFFLVYYEELLTFINIFFAQCRFAKCHSHHFKCVEALNFIFHPKFNTDFLNHQAQQSTSNKLGYQQNKKKT